MMMFCRTLAALMALLTPGMALAHDGHGHIDATSLWHWLLDFEHAGWLLPAAVLTVALILK